MGTSHKGRILPLPVKTPLWITPKNPIVGGMPMGSGGITPKITFDLKGKEEIARTSRYHRPDIPSHKIPPEVLKEISDYTAGLIKDGNQKPKSAKQSAAEQKEDEQPFQELPVSLLTMGYDMLSMYILFHCG